MKTRRLLGLALAASALAIVGAVTCAPPRQTTEKAGEFPEFAPVSGCELLKQDKVIILKKPVADQGRLLTAREHEPPFGLRIRAKTDSKNLRLYYNVGVVIFNWEGNENQLRIHDPSTNETMAVDGQGYIEPDKYHEITWEVYPNELRVLVNGKERARKRGNYEKLKAPVGIGPAFGSIITMEWFRVDPLKGKLPDAGEKAEPSKPGTVDPAVRRDKAIADYTEAIRRDPKDANQRGELACYKRGGLYAEKGEHDKAIADYTEAIRLYPVVKTPSLKARMIEVHDARAISYKKKGEYDKAIADYTVVIQVGTGFFPNVGEAMAFGGFAAGALYNRGVCHDEKGQPIKAVADFKRANEMGFTNADLQSRMKKARASYIETEHQGQLGPKEREKSYPTQMTAGKTYEIDLSSEFFHTRLRLEDDKGKVVAANDGISKDDSNSRLVFTPPADGSYRIVAGARVAGRTGPYTLHIRELPAKKK